MPRLLLVITLLLWCVSTAQAEHEPPMPQQCAAAHKAVLRAKGQVDVPVIPETMSREEQKAVLHAWKAQRQPAIEAAQRDFETCLRQYRR